MTAPSFAPGTDRPQKRSWKWKEPAQTWRSRNGDPFYTMVFNPQLENIIEDTGLPHLPRAIAFVFRTANGNLSDYCVDCMPKMDDRDSVPKRLTQTDMAAQLGISPASASAAVKFMREHNILLRETGGLYPNPCVEPDLFAQLRQNSDVSPLDTSETSESESDLRAIKQAFLAAYWARHATEAAECAALRLECEDLRAEIRSRRDRIRRVELEAMGAWRDEERRLEKAARHASHSANGTVQEVEPDSVSEDFSTPPPTNAPNSSGINEPAERSLKVRQEPPSSSSTGSGTEAQPAATPEATTTTPSTPLPTPKTPETDGRTDSPTPPPCGRPNPPTCQLDRRRISPSSGESLQERPEGRSDPWPVRSLLYRRGRPARPTVPRLARPPLPAERTTQTPKARQR